MASATKPSRPAPQAATPAEEQLVNAQIERTRRALKWVDLASGLITLVIGVLAFVLVVAILEHWVIPGGWSGGARVVLFVALLLSILWYSWRTFWPLVRKPINPAFAAQTIEQSSPSLKNSLLNLLLLRNRKRQLSRQVYQAIEQQAAQRLSEIPLDTTVDRTAVLRLGYILVAIVALCALYRIFSPKDFMASATRVLMPWADVTVPSRVQILDLTPGNTSAARGDQVVVSAEVMGLDEDEQVRVLYSTEDKQIVGQEIFMSPLEGGLRFECRLPSGIAQRGSGLQQDLTYWIEAGDARSPRYKVTVFSRPTLVVQRIQYDYPDYTGYPDREEAHTGDLHAIEGTVVTLTAIANQPISSAHVDFEADGRLDNLMKVDSQQASISFPLELRDDRRTPRHQSYVLRYTTEEGRKNELPPKYEIEVTPDYSPEVQVLLPEEESVDVALDKQVTIEVTARDPDFEVRDVSLLGEVDGQQVLKQVLLKKNHTGRFVKQYQLAPSELGLKVGDVIEYWATAADNRRPTANQASTKRRKIRIVGPGESGDNQGEKQPGEAGADQQSEEDSQQGEDGKEGTEEGAESSDSGDQQGEQGQEGEGNAGEGGVGQDAEGMQGEDAEQQPGQGGGQNQSSEGQENSDQNSEDAAGGESSGDQNNENPSQDNAGDQPGDSQSSEGGGNQEKVSPDGDDDGEAFDRMAEHFEEQQDESGQEGEAAEQQQGQGESADDNQQAQKGNNGAEGKPDTDQSGDTSGDEAEQGDTKGAEGQQQDENSEGEGAEGDPAPGQEGAGEEQGEQSQEDDSAGGEMSREQGEAGAGENPGENEGSPDARGDKKPHDRGGDEAEGEKLNDQEAPAQGEGQTESDSEGGQGGDKSGGGQEGGGQQADAKGTGGAGENQAADEGGGQSEQPGEGDTSSKPGGDQEAEGETGESSGNQPGKGSEQGQGGDKGEQQGDQSADQTGNSESMDPSTEQQPDQQNANNPDSSNPQGGQPSGGGTGSDSMPPPAGETQPGDEANLDYAQKQTDLILDKLDDQMKKKQVDEGLLEKLGWSQDELRRFVDRWKNLKSEADGKDATAEEAQQELSDALRSLGLGRNRRTGFRAKTAKDMFRDLQDAPRVRTPLEYQDRLRGYIKGTATAEEEE